MHLLAFLKKGKNKVVLQKTILQNSMLLNTPSNFRSLKVIKMKDKRVFVLPPTFVLKSKFCRRNGVRV